VRWKLAPDIQFGSSSQRALEPYGLVSVVRSFARCATAGLFSSVVLVSSGRITRIELFEIDDVAAVLARFAELRPDPLASR
jgi:hypothetical protein